MFASFVPAAFLLALWTLTTGAVLAAEPIDLSLRSKSGAVRAVTIHLKVGGTLNAKEPSPQAGDPAEAPESQGIPVAVEADIEYDEVLLLRDDGTRRSARFYDRVDATVRVGGNKTTPTFRDDRRLVVAEINEKGKQLRAVDGVLERTEFDTIDLWTDSLAVDSLLPEEPVAPGDSWSHDEATMLGFTGLDSIALCEVTSLLVEANGRFARCKLTGVVHGTAQGADTELELDANYIVDHQSGRVTKMSLSVKEKRAKGPAQPGFSGVVNLQYEATTLEKSTLLTQAMLDRVARQEPIDSPLLETRSDSLGFSATHDRDWYVTGSQGKSMTLRRVEGSSLIAHGNIARLTPKPLDPARALAGFRADTARMIGKAMTNLRSEEQWTNKHGCRVMAVVAEGQVAGVAMEWHTYLVVPGEESAVSHRLALTFTLEQSELKRLAEKDRALVDQIKLVPLAGAMETAGRSPIGEKLVQ